MSRRKKFYLAVFLYVAGFLLALAPWPGHDVNCWDPAPKTGPCAIKPPR